MNIANSIDNKTRFLVLHLDAGWTSNRISQALGISYSTIRDWTRRTEEGDDIRIIAEGRGRKPIISSEIKRKITRVVRRTPSKSSTRSLAHRFEMSNSTIYDILKEKSYKYSSSEIRRTLEEDVRADRVRFCEDMLLDNGRKLLETFYSDEMGIYLSEAHLTKIWHKSDKEMEIEIPKGKVRVSVWGAISFRGATSLHILQDKLDQYVYWDALVEHRAEMDELYPEGWYFIHDNHPSHGAVEDLMEEQRFGHIPFPTYSPDLNPIENMWATLKHSVAKAAPKNKGSLVKCLLRAWETLTTQENLALYFENLHLRYIDCIQKSGKRLKV